MIILPAASRAAYLARGEPMATLREAPERLQTMKRLAIAGVSRDPRQPANGNYRRLRAAVVTR